MSGLGQNGSQFCFLFGTTQPLTASQLDACYKNHATFVFAWLKSAVSAERKGFLVRADAKELVAAALRSDIGR